MIGRKKRRTTWYLAPSRAPSGSGYGYRGPEECSAQGTGPNPRPSDSDSNDADEDEFKEIRGKGTVPLELYLPASDAAASFPLAAGWDYLCTMYVCMYSMCMYVHM